MAERQSHELDLQWKPDRIPVVVRDEGGKSIWEGEMQARSDLSMGEQEILNRALARIREHQNTLRSLDMDDSSDEGMDAYEEQSQDYNDRIRRLEWQLLKVGLIDFPKEIFNQLSDHQRNMAVEEFFIQTGAQQSSGSPANAVLDAVRARAGAGPGPRLQSIRTVPQPSGGSNETTPGSQPDSSTTITETEPTGTG